MKKKGGESMFCLHQNLEQDTSDTNLFLDKRLGIARQRSEKTNKPVETESDDFILEIEV